MTFQIAARMLAVLSLAAAMTAAIMALRDDGAETDSAPELRHPGGEPTANELQRCRDIGIKALDDAACRKVWAANRRRFFGNGNPNRPAAPNDLPSKDPDRLPLQQTHDAVADKVPLP